MLGCIPSSSVFWGDRKCTGILVDVIKSGFMNPAHNDLPHPLPESEQAQTLTLLAQGCQQLGFALNEGQLAQFELFYQELVTWNQKLNLTAITEYQEVQTKHFLDALVGLPILAEVLGEPLPITRPLHCIDVGTGAGFPGIPLQIALPRMRWTLMDGTGKKVQFLRQLVAKLGLAHVNLVQGRAEELGRESAYRAQFDLVTARAVAPLNTLVEYLLPLVRGEGWAMIYKGASAPQEFMEARQAIELLGGETVRLAPVHVPFLDEKRFVLLIKKVRPTPNLYPRPQGLARKKPLG
jgi:16S rRNA (guanine527-N7)-methyltransferase